MKVEKNKRLAAIAGFLYISFRPSILPNPVMKSQQDKTSAKVLMRSNPGEGKRRGESLDFNVRSRGKEGVRFKRVKD